jgi:SAM-dependent methyltransferase
MTPDERRAAFEKIKAYFVDKDRERARKGKLPLGSTQKGFWGVSHLDDVYAWAQAIALHEQPSFLDLGSGDGRVALVAALFTKATGIEYDAALHDLAEQATKDLAELNLPASFVCGDYSEHSLAPHPVLFTYADHNFTWLEAKKHELTDEHVLYLYHDTYHPDFLAKGKIIWAGQIPIFQYTTKNKSTSQ